MEIYVTYYFANCNQSALAQTMRYMYMLLLQLDRIVTKRTTIVLGPLTYILLSVGHFLDVRMYGYSY